MERKKTIYPSKDTLNLLMSDRKPTDWKKIIPWIGVGVILLALFVKFGVTDRIAAMNMEEEKAQKAELLLEDMRGELKSFEEVSDTYKRYFSEAFDILDMPQDYQTVITLIEKYIMPRTQIHSIGFGKDTITVQVAETRLEMASDILKALYTEPCVKMVNVATASTDDDGASKNEATILITITLQEVTEK